MRHIFIYIICVSIWGVFVACGDGELNPLVSTDSDTDTDADTDSDSDSDSDSDTDTSLTCPLGSGYPCACDPQDGICDDGADCITAGPSSLGMCSLQCDPADYSTLCAATDGYGVGGWCLFDDDAPPESNQFDHCIVVCEHLGNEGPCPPGLVCMPHLAEGIPPQKICVPYF